MGLLPIPAPRLTQGASRAGFWRAAALYDFYPFQPPDSPKGQVARVSGEHAKILS